MKRFVISVCILLTAFSAFASDKTDEIKTTLSQAFSNMPVSNVTESEIPGLYEVQTGNNIIYSDGKYLMMGHMFDFTGKDITQEKINGLTAKMADSIDKKLAVKIGSGKKEVIEFTDPECPYCLKAEDFFKGADVTRLVYFMPLPFHKNAERLSVHVLCSKEPAAEYEKVMTAVAAGNADSFKTNSCESGKATLKKMMDAAQGMGVRGTPYFIIEGKVISGADPAIQQLIK